MYFIPHQVYHIYNRGNNKQRIFFSDRNYRFLLQKIETQLSPVCEMLCWCLMPNHFHLLIYATEKSCGERPSFGGKPMQELPFRIGKLLSSYSQAINKQNGTTGSLFQQKTKAKCVTPTGRDAPSVLTGGGNSYLLTCLHYIHQNPMKANLVRKMEDWQYSSFRGYMGMEMYLNCNQSLLLSLTGYDALTFYERSSVVIAEEELENIW